MISLKLIILLGILPSIIFTFFSKKELNIKAIILTLLIEFGWAMFMEFSYLEQNIWYWVPESSVLYLLARPVEDILFAIILIIAPISFYLWTTKFFKSSIDIEPQLGIFIIIFSIINTLIMSFFNLAGYTRYILIFSFLPLGILTSISKGYRLKILSLILTTLIVLIFSFIWNSLAVKYNIWGWNRENTISYIGDIPIDEIIFVIIVIPSIVGIYLACDKTIRDS